MALPLLAPLCRPVPATGEGVCPVCHGCPHPGYPTCWSCATVFAQVTHPCRRVVPISLYAIPGELHGALRRYKDGRCRSQQGRDLHAVGELVARFLQRHQACVAGDPYGFDLLTTVPSSEGRPGPHPLTRAVRSDPWLAARYRETLVAGHARLGHARASDHGFELLRPIGGARVVLLDVTLTTGARAQSAASALRSHGALVVAIVVVGRVVDPAHSPLTRSWWRQHAMAPFDLDRCCLEDAAVRSPPPPQEYSVASPITA
jgi:predicted amidophosphoribosyltransferase